MRKDNEIEQKLIECNAVSHKRKRKNSNKEVAEEPLSESTGEDDGRQALPLTHVTVKSNDDNLSPKKKRRKRNKRPKDEKIQGEKTPLTAGGNLGLSNVKKKKKLKKTNKKVSVCS